MSDAEAITLWHAESRATSMASIVPEWDGRTARLELTAPDLELSLTASGRDLFDALQQLRLRLEPLGWYPLCNGARVNCYPSGMARDMGGGNAVYILEMGKPGRPPLVPTFEAAEPGQVGTVTSQDAYHRQWLAARRGA